MENQFDIKPFNEFKQSVHNYIADGNCNEMWGWGERIFYTIESLYQVAEVTRRYFGTDIIDNESNSNIDKFFEEAYEVYKELITHENLHKPEFLENDEEEDDD